MQLAATSKNVYALDDVGVVWTYSAAKGSWIRLGGVPKESRDAAASLHAVRNGATPDPAP